MTIDEALEQSRKDFKDLFENQKETTMVENKEPDFNAVLVKKCLDIVRNNKKVVIVKYVSFYTVYKWRFFSLSYGDEIFDIHKHINIYRLRINNVDYLIPMDTPGVEELYDTCAQKYYERIQQRANATLNFLDDYVEKKQETKVGLWKRLFNRQK